MKTRILNALEKLKKNEGMTLIEIMIVVAIIAILLGLVTPNLMNRLKQANVVAAKQGINVLKLALQDYALLNNGSYPEDLETLANEGLLKAKDLRDPWGNPYQYVSPGEHDWEYDIYSYGADGKEGGEGLDADIVSWE